MSVFRGSVAEYPGVIIDHFVPHNCDIGRAFFLSHCHRDHMSGLGSPNIVRTLQARRSSFHCSEVTQALLTKDPEFASLVPYLNSLPMEEPVAMRMESVGDFPPLSFTVTLLPAGHCPGSVMFFFQGPGGNVLYTGDFRLTLPETKRLRPLHTSQGLINITALYLDTTFCHPIATTIPSRETSRDKVLEIMERWLTNDRHNVVRLHCGTFGYEHILLGVARRFKCKIHIASWKMAAYSEMPAVAECLTADGNSTRIHCCLYKKGEGTGGREGLPCGSCPVPEKESMRVLHIKPSTLWFLSVAKSMKEPYVFLHKASSCRVIHSMHASYEELRQFICYLKPRRIVPCVLPIDDATFASLHVRLKSLLPEAEIDSSACVSGAGGDNGRGGVTGSRGGACKIKSWKSVSNNKEEEQAYSALEEGVVDTELDSCLTEDASDTRVYDYSLKFPQGNKKEESFLLPVPDVPRPLLPSMLEVTGGVIAPPRYGKKAEVNGGVVESLEQTPLDLDSSDDNPCSQSPPGKGHDSAHTRAPEQGGHVLTRKPQLGTKRANTDTKPSVKRRNLTRTVYSHYDNCLSGHAATSLTKLTDLTKKQTPNNDHHFDDKIPINDHRNDDVIIIDAPCHPSSSTDSQARKLSEERAISLEWEESEGSQSPSILPLTPGKEDVTSILHRQNLTLL